MRGEMGIFEDYEGMDSRKDDPTEYIISAIIKGDRQAVKAEALSRGIKVIYAKPRDAGRNCWCLIEHKHLADVVKWFAQWGTLDAPYPVGTMLHYSVLEA